MADQTPKGRQGVSTVNLNALSADSVQLDYLAKEQQAAGELLTLQTKNAQKLAELRLGLLNKLMDETKKRGEEVETNLADFHHAKALDNIIKEAEEVKDRYGKLYTEQQAIQQQNLRAIRQAETQLASFRLSNLKLEAAQRLKDISAAEKAELAALKKRAAADPKSGIDLKALDAAEATVDATLADLTKSLEEARAEQTNQTAELLKREAELLAENNTTAIVQRREAIQQLVDAVATNPELQVRLQTEGVLDELEDLIEQSEAVATSRTSSIAPTEDIGQNLDTQLQPTEARLAELRTELNGFNVDVQSGLSAAEQAELEVFSLRMNNLTTEHIQRMLYQDKAVGKYRISVAEEAALEEELVRRKKDMESSAILELFSEREEAEVKTADRLAKQQRKELKEKLGRELDYLAKVKDENGAQKYSESFSKQMLTETVSVTRKDENGQEVAVSKSRADLTSEELNKVQAEELRAFNEKARKDAQTLEADARVLAVAEAQPGATEAEIDEAAKRFVEQLTAAREQERADLMAKHAQEQDFLADRAEAEKQIVKDRAKEESKFAKSKLGKAADKTKAVAGRAKEAFAAGGIKGFGGSFAESIAKEKAAEGKTSEEIRKEMQEQLNATMGALGDYISNLNQKGQESAKKQTSIDTNLQGSQLNDKKLGSYWRRIDSDITKAVGISPFVTQEDVAASVETLAGMGISFNIEQRAFLNTIKDKIATTFEANDGTLRKLIRIQQADTTAARLGMESAMTSFLNSMYETSEFMREAASGVRQSLYEATALMQAEHATEYEYQVQKWLGSLYSVGFNSSQKVADTLGKITAGDIAGVTEGGMSNLLIMAANEASLPIAEILEKGLTPDQTNRLMKSMVEYLARIYEDTNSSNVLAQQYANVFGVTAADLKAAANLQAKGLDNIAEENKYAKLSYDGLEKQLKDMANSMVMRTSMAEFMENMKANLNYTFATTIANNPVLSGLNMMANMLNDLVGGIEIPFVNVYGFGFDLNATVADLMNVAALSGTVLGGMGKLLASLGSAGGFSGSGMLKQFGVDFGNGATKLETRGGSSTAFLTAGGSTTSESGSIAGNESGDDVMNKTVADNSEGPEKQIAEAKEEQEDKEDARTNLIAQHIVDIYELLQEVTIGSKKWHVQLEVGNNPASWSTGTWT